VPGRSQQGSACFINSVQDSMESILELVKTEGMLFKFGSGTGTNLSVLRSSREQLSGGGTASGPVSFMKGYDSFAGSIKSGGTTRRAAKMVILNADHPDVLDFIRCKAEEEKKAWALIEAGYNVGFNVPGGAYDSVQFQNANNSVRVSDGFMKAVESDKEWETKAVVGGRTVDTYKARKLWREIADATWICGDPGLQFDTTIQDWNVVPNTGRINATNPCSEFVFLDDTACNLLSLNLMKFQSEDGAFNVDRFKRAVDICFTGQEILVSNASYPTPAIAKNSEALRPLGLGYANLGALLMSMGLAYDSAEGVRFAGAVTAIMTGEAFQGAVQRVPQEPRADAAGDGEAPPGGAPAQHLTGVGGRSRCRTRHLGRCGQARTRPRLPKRPGHGPRTDGLSRRRLVGSHGSRPRQAEWFGRPGWRQVAGTEHRSSYRPRTTKGDQVLRERRRACRHR